MKDKNWQEVVKAFSDELQPAPGQFFVKDMCEYLLHPMPSQKPWKDADQVIEYLSNWRTISLTKAEFHRKWATQDSNLKRIAELDFIEAQKVTELIDLLSK